jgi:hypothetical protein
VIRRRWRAGNQRKKITDKFTVYCKELETDIQHAYESAVTLDEAERLAAKFLGAQMQVSARLRTVDLDRRMRKRGLKAVRAAVRTEEIKKYDKKPTESALEDALALNEMVTGEESAFDEAEVNTEELERLYDVFHEAHVYYRGIAKGKFE